MSFTYRFVTVDTFDAICPIPQFACAARTINVSAHVANHGHRPRGKGRWMFECQQSNGEWILLCFDGPGSYLLWSQAKWHALNLANTHGFIRVKLAS